MAVLSSPNPAAESSGTAAAPGAARAVAARFVVGIDLGTTHCVVASAPLTGPVPAADAVRIFAVPQLVAPGEVADRPLLPSFLYLPAEGEFAAGDRGLPWGEAPVPVGELARKRGAQAPTRLVASAKSWICHGGVNRRAPILPWGAPDSEPHLSPFDAQVLCLAHLRAAWDAAHPEAPLRHQEVVVTVPASFDEVARALTAEAAAEAGLPAVRLIEEPQAAFYDFLGAHRDDLAAAVGDARLALVVDVGGGTTDLTLVRIEPGEDGSPRFERVAVGGHLMLGGDNMDAALAHFVLKKSGIERKLDPTEWAALVQAARLAKEQLLAADAPESAPVTLMQRGSRLIGGTRTVTVTRAEAEAVLVDGFVPFTGPAEVADRGGRAGLTTLGLPYTSDPAIPRHVCAFLRRHVQAAAAAGAAVVDGLPRPDRILFNGGVFAAPALQARLEAIIAGWFGAGAVTRLPHTSLDTAVACGAVRFALGRRGVGPAIGGGTARAYYVGVAGADGRARAFCVAPKGMEEGRTVEVVDRRFHLVLDRPVAFPIYGFAGDRVDAAGKVVDLDPDFEALPAVRTVLRQKGDLQVDAATGAVPVRLSATLTESGTLALSLVTVELPPQRWRLDFALAGEGAEEAEAGATLASQATQGESLPEEPPPDTTPLPAGFLEARRTVERTYGGGRLAYDAEAAAGLRATVERAIGPRGQWTSGVCRALFDCLLAVAPRRGTTAVHELNWLRLASFCVRPGVGAHGDAARVEALWALHAEGLKHPEAKANHGEWWILWRRAAAGLSAARQAQLCADVAPWLAPQKGPPPPGPRAHGQAEMLRLLAALDRLTPEAKTQAGGWLLAHFKQANSWWPLGRLGARVPPHGSARSAVPPAVAAEWLDKVLPLDWKTADGAAFAAVMLARFTGDPARDLDAERRAAVVKRLTEFGAPSPWITQVTQAVDLSEGDTGRVLGDALPAGLRLA